MAATLSYQAQDNDGGTISGSSTYTFALTVASASGQERLVGLAGVGTLDTTADFSACTIDGQTATRVGSVSRGADDGSNTCAFVTWYRAAGTAGTSINVVATFSGGSCFAGYCALWSLNDADTLLASTNAAVTDPTLNTNTAAGGSAAAIIYGYSNPGAHAAAWTGLTERFDGGSVFADEVFSGASNDFVSASTPLSISVAIDLSNSVASSCVSFNPDAGGAAAAPSTLMLMGMGV